MKSEEKERLRRCAHSYLRAGLSLVVMGAEKIPIHGWKKYQTELMTPKELDHQLAREEATGVAVVGGYVSGGAPDTWLVVVDFDNQANNCYAYLHGWLQTEPEYGGQGWPVELVSSLPLVRSGKEEYRCHMYLKVCGGEPYGNRKMAYDTPAAGKDDLLVEAKSEGGYAVAPASQHPSGNFYRHMRGDIKKIPVIKYSQWLEIVEIIERLDRRPKVTRQPISPGTATVELKAVPLWLMNMCAQGARPGERNSKLVEVRCALQEYGVTGSDLDQLTSQFLRSSGYGRTRAEINEIEATIASADKRAAFGSKKYVRAAS